MPGPVRRIFQLDVAFALLVTVMAAHEAEHVAQVLQKNVFPNRCPGDCRGALGFVFDLEWVHFAYNLSILFAIAGLAVAYRLWRPDWRRAAPWAVGAIAAGILIQSYHAVEHVVKLHQWFVSGHHSPTPGILGRSLGPPEPASFSLIELHFILNTAVFICIVIGYFGLGFGRRAWPLSRRLGTVPALATVAVLIAAPVAGAWATRTPTVVLPAGYHRGPLVIDDTQALVGEPGAVVKGGILITADGVTVRGITVEAGDHGIEVDGAKEVLLDDVHVRGAVLDGINVRRSQVRIQDCSVTDFEGDYGQGIDISFAADLAPSVIEDCEVDGGQEGIYANSVNALIRENFVRNATLRGITVTEMSMATVEGNEVERALGIGIFCSDYSHCQIHENAVRATRADRSSSDGMRAGYAIVSHYWSQAALRDNDISQNPGGIKTFANARITTEHAH
jgi:nitrous oxidase accessory protein NosD